MNRDDVYEILTPIFRDVFDNDSVAPTDSMTAAEVEEWDSLSHIRLVVAVEEKFKIRFSTIEINDLKNVGDFVDLINKKLEQ